MVKGCFGKYGEKPPEKIIKLKDGFEKRIGCTVLCKDGVLCRECYWKWYFKKKRGHKKIMAKDEIKMFMRKNKLRFERRQR